MALRPRRHQDDKDTFPMHWRQNSANFVAAAERKRRENASEVRVECDKIGNCVAKKLGPLRSRQNRDRTKTQMVKGVQLAVSCATSKMPCDKIRAVAVGRPVSPKLEASVGNTRLRKRRAADDPRPTAQSALNVCLQIVVLDGQLVVLMFHKIA